MSILLNSETDNTIDVADLQAEFRKLPSVLYKYSEAKAGAEEFYDLKKMEHEELRSEIYLKIKSSGEKLTEANVSAMIDTDPRVKAAIRDVYAAKRDLETIKGYVMSMNAKKDMLIQLGSDRRKEL